MHWKPLGALIAIAAMGSMVDAHPFNWVQGGIGDFLVVCPETLGVDVGTSIGGVCVPAGHIVPDANGQATLTPSDDLFSPSSAYYCQDTDDDGVCGELGEPTKFYCGAVTIEFPPFDETHPIYWFADGPANGNPLTSVCGTLSMTSRGVLNHS